MINIAVLLTVFNRKEKTLKCLENLYCQELPDTVKMDVYLTNDGCTDGTPEAVASQFPQVHIINADGNLYWNRGMYTAWEAAAKTFDYDYYLWLNDDTFVYTDMLESLLSLGENYDGKAIIVGATISTDHKRVTYGGWHNGKLIEPNGQPVEADCINGNIVLVPRSVYRVLGNLDYYFTHSKGDFDYGMRAKKKGIKMYVAGKYLGECDLHESLDKWCNPEVPFNQRWKALHRPNGMPPKETFHLEKRHYGIITALFHYFTIYTRCLFPNIWVKMNKA